MLNSGELLYSVNLWVIALVVVGLLLLPIEVGFRVGGKVSSSVSDNAKGSVMAISGATLGLLALLLGFTFSMALTRFEQRKQLVPDEANAIGTAYLRAKLLPEPERSVIDGLLRSYVDARLEFYGHRNDPLKFRSVVDRSETLHNELWTQATNVVQKDHRPVTTSLFIQALNQVIDLHTERLAATQNHVPETVLLLLFLVAVLASLLVGYGCGLATRRNLLSTCVVALLIGMVIIVIMDLDRPNRGMIRVDQESMRRLRDTLKTDAP